MNALRHTFFEDPFYVYALLAVAAAATAVVWYRRREVKLLLAAAMLVAIAAGVYLLERAVVTDREQILAAYDDIARAVAHHDIDRLAAWLDGKYRGWGGPKLAAAAAAKAAAKAYNVREVRYVGEIHIAVAGRRADSRVATLILYGDSAERPARALLGWEVEWVKRDADWRIRRATTSDSVLP